MQSLSIRLLSAADASSAFTLYSLCAAAAPAGFLARRSSAELARLLADAENSVAVGAFADRVLVAYSMCHRIDLNPYPQTRILEALRPASEIVYHGDGTVVHPEYRGLHLMQRLYKARRQELLERKVDHTVGLIALDNIASLGNVLVAGGLLVGFAEDESGDNYVGYAGRLSSRLLEARSPLFVPLADRARQRQLFADGAPVRALSPSGEDRRFEFAVNSASAVHR